MVWVDFLWWNVGRHARERHWLFLGLHQKTKSLAQKSVGLGSMDISYICVYASARQDCQGGVYLLSTL